jgi:hypothetical protein
MPAQPLDLDLDAFLALGWSPGVRNKLQDIAAQSETKLLLASQKSGKLAASVFTEEPDKLPAGVMAVWRKDAQRDAGKSKTQQAVDLVLAQGLTPHAAAAAMKVHASAVYRALTRAQEKPLCPCCRQAVREGFSVDESVLKTQAAGQSAS